MSDTPPTAVQARRRAVEAAIANARIEGIGPTPEPAAILKMFVAGKIDRAEMVRLIGAGTLSNDL